MTAPELRVNAWHQWDNQAVEIPHFNPDANRQKIVRNGKACFIRNDDLTVVGN